MDHPHGVNHLFLDLRFTYNIKGGQKVIGYRDQGVLWPAAEPIHGATADQSWKFERTVSEFFANLEWNRPRFE